ncbi:shikimate dehydrogenase [Deinococcus lacus]|uniref:Shikimate dehydrogenase n=1 Tax=Deinococcus lacus TaxID=392561 RepID=A0ABW1YC08_9DEIO
MTARAFLFADPVAHSLSPRLHAAAFAWAGLDGVYQAVRVAPCELPVALRRLKEPGTLGANLSLPHKEVACSLLDRLSDAAGQIGAVNTVIRLPDGRLLGDNTDAPGLVAALQAARLDSGCRAVVLGAGGAARAAVYALSSPRSSGGLGMEVTVINRRPERAEALAAAWPGRPVVAALRRTVAWEDIDLLVNATSAGLSTGESPLPDFDWLRLPRHAGVYDMVYGRPTQFLQEAGAAGLRAEGVGHVAAPGPPGVFGLDRR